MVSWDRPNTFTYWCAYDSYKKQRTSYILYFVLVPDFDDVENKTNVITQLPFASTQQTWRSIYLHVETNDYYLEGRYFFHETTYKSYSDEPSSNYVSGKKGLGYKLIYHLNKGTQVNDYFSSQMNFSRVNEYNPIFSMSFPTTTIDNLMSVSDLARLSIPVYRTSIYY